MGPVIGAGGVLSGGGSRKNIAVQGGGGHYMKNKNIGGRVFCRLNLISKQEGHDGSGSLT